MHMQNLKANTVRTAFCALLVSFALVFAGAAQVAVAPTNAYALDTAKCTAKPNVSGSSDVLGGVETRITWEGQADPDEQIAGVTFTLPEGTTCEPGDTRATMLTGDDLMTRTNLDVSVDYKDGKIELTYTNCKVVVKIDNTTGKIVEGSWAYDVNVYANGIKVSIVSVNNLKGIVAFSYTAKG